MKTGAGSPLLTPAPVGLTSLACISGVASACSVGLSVQAFGVIVHRALGRLSCTGAVPIAWAFPGTDWRAGSAFSRK